MTKNAFSNQQAQHLFSHWIELPRLTLMNLRWHLLNKTARQTLRTYQLPLVRKVLTNVFYPGQQRSTVHDRSRTSRLVINTAISRSQNHAHSSTRLERNSSARRDFQFKRSTRANETASQSRSNHSMSNQSGPGPGSTVRLEPSHPHPSPGTPGLGLHPSSGLRYRVSAWR